MRSDLFGFHGGNQLLDQADVGVVDHLRIGMAVHRGQMHDGVALTDEVPQLHFIGEEFVLEGDPLDILLSSQQIEEVGPHEPRLSRNADFYHFNSLHLNQ